MSIDDNISPDEAELMLFIADELDPVQRRAFEDRLAAEPTLRQRFADCQMVDACLKGERSKSSATAYLSDRALKSSLRLVREQVLSMNQTARTRSRSFRIPPYAVAAGIAVFFTLGFIGWLYNTPPVTQSPLVVNTSTPNGPGVGQGFPTLIGLTSAFSPIGVDQYADTSQRIDQEIDALSMLSDFEETTPN